MVNINVNFWRFFIVGYVFTYLSFSFLNLIQSGHTLITALHVDVPIPA